MPEVWPQAPVASRTKRSTKAGRRNETERMEKIPLLKKHER
jgi:hypothetical protein